MLTPEYKQQLKEAKEAVDEKRGNLMRVEAAYTRGVVDGTIIDAGWNSFNLGGAFTEYYQALRAFMRIAGDFRKMPGD